MLFIQISLAWKEKVNHAMVKDTTNVTVRELYSLVDQKMGQVNASIVRLENKFDNLESGRLTANEKALSDLGAQVAGIKGQTMMIPLIITIAANAFFFILNFILNK